MRQSLWYPCQGQEVKTHMLVYHKTVKRPMTCEGCGAICADAFTYFVHVSYCDAYRQTYAESFTPISTLTGQ